MVNDSNIITIDSIESKMKVNKFSGNHSQETREGYNLWDYLNVVKASTGGLTIEKDYENGYITVNGTPNANYVYISSSIIITDMLEDGQRYTLWQEVYASEGITDGIYMQVTRTADNEENIKYYSRNNLDTFKVDKSNNATYSITLQTSTIDGTGTLTNYKNRYMLYKGTDEKTYELPGASPSLDYPSPVRAVGDNVNMFNVWESGTISNSGNIESSDIAIRTADFISVKSNTSYTYKIYDETISNIALFEYDENSNFIKVMYNLNTEQTIVTSETTRKVKMRIVSTDLSTKMKFEEGEVATSYSPYGQGSVEVKKANKNWFDTSIQPSQTLNGINIINNNDGSYTINGTATSTAFLKALAIPKFLANYTYVCFGLPNDCLTNISYIGDTYGENIIKFTPKNSLTNVQIRIPSGVTINATIKPMLIEGNSDLTISDYIQHESEVYNLPIQQPMLKGDYFDLERGKEVHKWIERELTGTENITLTDTVNGIAQFTFSQFYDGDYDTGSVNINALSNCYKGVPYQSSWLKDNSISLVGGYAPRIMTSEYSTVEEFKQMLAGKYAEGNPVKIYYKLIKPKELGLTEEQKSVLQQLSELPLFKGTNNIITAESLALLQMSYIADTQSYIDSKLNNINQQILELAGGN